MKAVFVSIATLALSVFAAPSVAEGSVAVRSAAVVEPEFAVLKRDQTAEDLINAINKATDNINTIGISISKTMPLFSAGCCSALTLGRRCDHYQGQVWRHQQAGRHQTGQ